MGNNIKVLALYLPQYHPIPENDKWYGRGFTEWTNVGKAKPLFRGHYQPQVPADLGYYDLRVPETRLAQAELACEFGVTGFCYWHYWFGNGRRLLERPFNEVLRSGEPDFPFCLGWANHSWKGIYNGVKTKESLIEQEYGGIEDYERITTAVLRTMHQHYYCAKNCTCYLSGYVTDEILKLIESELGEDMWGSAEGISPSLVDCLPESWNGKRCFIERPEALQSAVRMGCFTVDSLHPDFLKLRFMVTLFGGYFGSRLMKNIREDKGYTYGIGAGLVAYPFRNMLVVNTQAANEYANEVIREVNYEMERLQAELVSSEELDMVKNYVMGDMCRSYESPFSMADAYIFLETSGLSDDFFTRAQQTVAEITAEDVRDMDCKYLRKESFTEVIAGKKCDEMDA